MARIVGAFFNSALWGIVVALAFSKWTWLEMRFNVGWILYGVWIVSFVVLLWRTRKPLGFKFSVANTLLSLVLCFALSNGFAGIAMLPACLVREGVMQPAWNVGVINIVMLLFVAIFLLLIAFLDRVQRSGTGASSIKRGK